jgi:hypothetical protein
MTKQNASLSVPEAMKVHYNHIAGLIEPYCKKYLDEEYALLALKAAAALSRKRPSPLLQGKPNTWACGIIYAIGYVNFLFDKSFPPFVTADELAQAFSISKSTAGNKSKQVRDLLKMHQFDFRWYVPSRLADSSLPWMITFNGFIVDARELPREVQVIAHEKKLIPYVFADTVD